MVVFVSAQHVLFYFICTLCLQGGLTIFENEQDLMEHVMKGYNKYWRPVKNFTNSLNINIHSYVRRIENLDEQNEILSTTLQILMMWKDENLTWNVSDTNQITTLEISPELIWLPKFDIYNRVYSSESQPLDLKKAQNVILASNGQIQVTTVLKVETSCEVNLLKFPFDVQNCKIFIGPYTFTSYINLKPYDTNIDMGESDYSENYFGKKCEWMDVKSNLEIEYIEKVNGIGMSLATIHITMRRNPVYYVIYLLIPSVLMAFVSVLVFLLPPESGERIGLSITVLLAYTVFSLMVSEVTPRGGQSISVLVCYITSMSCLSVLILFINVLIVKGHNKRMDSNTDDSRIKCIYQNSDYIAFTVIFIVIIIATVLLFAFIMS